MKEYAFQSGETIIRLRLTRPKLEIMTNNPNAPMGFGRFVPQSFMTLFGDKPDPNEIVNDYKKMEFLPEELFEKQLLDEFAKKGFILLKKGD